MYNSAACSQAKKMVSLLGIGMICLPGAGLLFTIILGGIWPFETAAYWVPCYGVISLAGCLLCLSGRCYVFAGGGILCAVVSLALMVPPMLPRDAVPKPDGKETFRLLQANVYSPGNDPDELLALIHDNKPDIVLLQEVDAKWQGYLKPLEDLYAHHHLSARYPGGSPDLAQYWSCGPGNVRELADLGIPGTETLLTVHGQKIRLFNIHTAAPFERKRARRYAEQMKQLGEYVSKTQEPVIIAGDLNTCVWSQRYHDLLNRANLVSVRRGFGLLGTWPSFLGPLRIALDHILTSPDIKTLHCRVGPGIGSDHRPLLADLFVE